jgi:hypothetical protein
LQAKTVRTSDTDHQICFLRDGRRKAAFLAVACGVHRCASANIMLDADPTLRSRPCPISLIVSVALSGLHQIPQQVGRHRQLGERKATGSDLLDRTADARSFRMGGEPVLGGLLAGLAGCQHIRDQSSFGGCDLVEARSIARRSK